MNEDHSHPVCSSCTHGDGSHERTGSPELARRTVLAGIGGVVAGGLAGCLGDDDETAPDPEPIALDDGHTCDVCGMVIADHYGPAGQIFYDDQDVPATFDSITELLTALAEAQSQGPEPRALFVTDYSRVDYDIETRDGTQYISTHVDSDDFAAATDCSYVTESAVDGAMGADYFPFADSADAEAFVEEHGGQVVSWTDFSSPA